LWNRLLREYCDVTGIDPDVAAEVVRIEQADTLPTRLPTTELATGSVAAAALSAALLAGTRAGRTGPRDVAAVHIDARRVAASFMNDRLQTLDGRGASGWAALSGFWPSRDGWVRTHANYPHHRARLLDALGLPGDTDRDAFRERCQAMAALEIEERVAAAGGVAVAVRTPEVWALHPQAAAVATRPLVGIQAIGSAPVRELPPAPERPVLPAAGLRVLDLTRVIAGPVATRTLALLGAQVLRIDSPGLPEIAWQYLDNGAGKRSALLDLNSADARSVFEKLLATADIVVIGYRPGALNAFGLSADALAARRPGIVVASLSAWGGVGPWGARRGFDSIVQAASGIALIESDDGAPGALPAQALDHATGYLLAAAVLHAVDRQAREGGTWHVAAHLARTGQWLTSTPNTHRLPAVAWDPNDCLVGQKTRSGVLRYAPPAVAFSGGPADYPTVGGTWGTDAPTWV
jgi:crotonobetainyl-CoA:carnitine CoA-transferase CaiB-like acyl-CoA transferase